MPTFKMTAAELRDALNHSSLSDKKKADPTFSRLKEFCCEPKINPEGESHFARDIARMPTLVHGNIPEDLLKQTISKYDVAPASLLFYMNNLLVTRKTTDSGTNQLLRIRMIEPTFSLYYDAEEKSVFLTLVTKKISAVREETVLLELPGSVTTRTRLTDKGFEIHDITATDPALENIILSSFGAPLKNKYDSDWLTLLSILTNKQPSLSKRLKDRALKIFDITNANKNYLSTLLGFPTDNNFYSKIVYALGGFILTPLKNLVKGAIELVPALLEELTDWMRLQNKLFLNDKVAHTPLQTGAAYIGFALGTTLHYTFKAIRQVTMRITSPIRSAEEAYEFGKPYHLGSVFAFLSTAVSIAAWAAITVIALPLLPLIAVPVITHVVASVTWAAQLSAITDTLIATALAAATFFAPALGVHTGLKKLFTPGVSNKIAPAPTESSDATIRRMLASKTKDRRESFSNDTPTPAARPAIKYHTEPFLRPTPTSTIRPASQKPTIQRRYSLGSLPAENSLPYDPNNRYNARPKP